MEDNKNNGYEKICCMCRRTESQAGKMITLPGGLQVCRDCMQRSFDMMMGSGMDWTKMSEITPELFEKLERLIGKPLIAKERRTYALKNGLKLEVNDVDAGLPSHFMYAEVEYPDEPTACAWTPTDDALTHYLSNECTGQPGASMGEYWTETRK